ncbi:MAG: DUF853 family protein, partial [Bacteroidaceae bacterium]|nr:DUF853 family protein [Bacteroidaceae bacterium]
DEAIMNLETGEALVSFLDEKGAPSVVERAKILFPLSQIGAITEGQRLDAIKQSDIYGKYDTPIDRESAYEVLLQQAGMEEAQRLQHEEEESAAKAEKDEKQKTGKSRPSVFAKVTKAVMTAVTATVASMVGTMVSDAVTGKKTKSRTSVTGKIAKNATQAATRTLTRDILGNLVK